MIPNSLTDWLQVIVSFGDGLALNRQKAITITIDDPVNGCIYMYVHAYAYASTGLNELTQIYSSPAIYSVCQRVDT